MLHVASFGMSGSSQLQRTRIEDVNVNGTKHVRCAKFKSGGALLLNARQIIAACMKYGAARLVYVSTYNVIFNGQVCSSRHSLLQTRG